MSALLIDTSEKCGGCARTDGLLRGWCPACLPGAIDDLMQWAQDRDDVAHDALARLDGIAEIVERQYEGVFAADENLSRIYALAQAPQSTRTWVERLRHLHDELLNAILGPNWSGRTTSHNIALEAVRERFTAASGDYS